MLLRLATSLVLDADIRRALLPPNQSLFSEQCTNKVAKALPLQEIQNGDSPVSSVPDLLLR